MRRRNGMWSLLSLLMIAGLLAAACTSGNQGGNASPSAGDQLDPNGEITTNMGSEPDTIDPQKESFVGEVAQTMQVYEALLTFDPATLKPIPGAAKDMPKLSSDGLTYTFTLRDGLKYSDGSAVKAKDFAYGFTRLCDPNTGGEYAFTGYIIAGCEAWNEMDPKKATQSELDAAKGKLGIKVNGDNEISFTLTEKAPYFLSIAALWVGVPTRESDVQKGGDKWTEPATFIGNGPFKLVDWKHNEKMVYERNDNYRTPAKLKRWTKVMINEGSVAFAAYQNNELDMFGVAAEQLRTIDADANLKSQLVTVGGSCTIYVGFNTAKPPFDDAKTRLAFAKSFDKQAYINDIAKIGKPAGDAGGFIPPGMPGFDKDDNVQKFDPAAAKQLLSQGKYANSDTLKNLKFTYPASAANKTRIEWLQQQWQTNLGITVTPDPVDSTTYTTLVKKPETTPLMFRLGWCADYPDQQDWLTTVFHSSSTVTHTGYKNADFDKLTRQADADPNPESRDKTYLQASKQLSTDAAAAWWYYTATEYLKKPWVKGIKDTVMDFEYGIFDQIHIGVTAKK
ncbi:MAG TPA: peptide ABC transporter substrate-binding protein [Candidatus Limnocylindria bacterium]